MFLRWSLALILFYICVIQHTMAEAGKTRIVILGMTGAGKSSLANTITNSTEFPVSGGAQSETKQCKLVSTTRNGLSVSVVDTPGFFDTDTEFTDFEGNLIEFLNITSPGPHVVFYIQEARHYTKQSIESMNKYIKMFGEAILPFTVLVFTKVDCTEHEYMQDLHPELKTILEKCNSRYVFLPRMDKKQEMNDKIDQLFDIVRDMLIKNKNQHYTNTMYKTQQEVIDTELKNQREEEKRKEDVIRAEEEARLEKNGDKQKMEQKVIEAEQDRQTSEAAEKAALKKAEDQRLEIEKMEQENKRKQDEIAAIQRGIRENNRRKRGMRFVRIRIW